MSANLEAAREAVERVAAIERLTSQPNWNQWLSLAQVQAKVASAEALTRIADVLEHRVAPCLEAGR